MFLTHIRLSCDKKLPISEQLTEDVPFTHACTDMFKTYQDALKVHTTIISEISMSMTLSLCI